MSKFKNITELRKAMKDNWPFPAIIVSYVYDNKEIIEEITCTVIGVKKGTNYNKSKEVEFEDINGVTGECRHLEEIVDVKSSSKGTIQYIIKYFQRAVKAESEERMAS